MIRLLPRVNLITDRRWLARFPFFGLTGAGAEVKRTRGTRSGGISARSAGTIFGERSGGIRAMEGRP